MGERIAVCSRQTKETTIQIKLNLDGTGNSDIHTGIGFFDHMLAGFAKHGLFDLEVSVKGDLEVDCHHTIEDTDMDTEMVKEFFYAVSYSAMMNLHLKIMEKGNQHHMCEALFKAFGKALAMAVSEEPRMKDVWSTKGSL